MCCRHSSTSRKRKSISVNQLRLAFITILAVQSPNVLCIILTQLSQVLAETSDDVVLNFKDIDFTNVTALDIVARRAMKRLHDDLDHDDDGNVSLSEGAKFLHRGEFKGHSGGNNLPGFETDKDGRITEIEFWDAWVNSAVHNWTVHEMVEWLSDEVELPQYATKFKQYGICGAAMPIIASNSSVVLSLVEGSKEHRLKLWLKALDIVVCGYTHSKSSLLKDILLTISIGVAIGGILFGIHVRRNAAVAITNMHKKLNNLQKELQKLDEEEDVVWMKDVGTSEEERNVLETTEHSGSSSSLNSETSIYSRLMETQEELIEAKNLLESAEEQLRMSEKRWTPPPRLLACLKNTYQVEMKLHEFKRSQAQTKFQKMKKKISVFSSIHFIHSRQVDSFDMDVQLAKDALRTVQRDFREKRKRWNELESLCHCKFITSSVITSPSIKSPKPTQSANEPSKHDQDTGSTANISTTRASVETVDQLGSLKDVSKIKSFTKSDMKSHKSMSSCPSLVELHEKSPKQISGTLMRSSSDANTRNPNLHNNIKVLPESKSITSRSPSNEESSHGNFENHCHTFPRKNRLPKVEHQLISSHSTGPTTNIPSPALSNPNLTPNKSVSCQSLPDLIGEAKMNGKEETKNKSPLMERKSKRGFSSIFKNRRKLK